MKCMKNTLLLVMVLLVSGCQYKEQPIPKVSGDTWSETGTEAEATAGVSLHEAAQVTEPAVQFAADMINPEGTILEDRIRVPQGYTRVEARTGSFQAFMRGYAMKQDGSPVMLYNGTEKYNQSAQAAVLDMPVFNSDLQQCADSIMRAYGEYFWSVGAYEKIAFHLTNGFLMDYPAWREGNRLSVQGNQVSWVKKASYDDSYDTFLLYLKYVMMYAGTRSLDEESITIDISTVLAGDMFLKGGSPGHCVMVADVARDEEGNQCYLLAQGYMPAQDFHILNNPLHEEDPWYYASELEYPLTTPEYSFQEGSFQRWYGFR